MENITLCGMDLAKECIHIVCQNHQGRLLLKRRVRRTELASFVRMNVPRGCVIAMEACGSAQYWAREFESMGYRVRLIAPQFVKPYRKSDKNDYNDAEAICEAASRESMRFVGIKSREQQDMLALHRIRAQIVKQQTATSNGIRGFLMEHGLFIARGAKKLRSALQELSADGSDKLSIVAKSYLNDLWVELRHVDERLKSYDRQLMVIAGQEPLVQRLMTQPGVGKLSATAVMAHCADPCVYKNGRNYAASIGLVARQHSSGGRSVLGPITKRGDRYIRTLLVHGARSAIRTAAGKTDELSLWVTSLKERKGANIAAVALANKNARRLWALMKEYYQGQAAAPAA